MLSGHLVRGVSCTASVAGNATHVPKQPVPLEGVKTPAAAGVDTLQQVKESEGDGGL